MIRIKNPDGKYRLHIWRTGTAFEYTNRFHLYKEWNNIKFATLKLRDEPPYIFHLDLREPLPYPDDTFNVVYCNHVAEHLTPDEGISLVKELHRVLEPGGICRLVVPDLERSATEYLECLMQVGSDPSADNIRRYEWAVADLIDQMVRQYSGGTMWPRLITGDVDWAQIQRCNGDVFENVRTGKYLSKQQNIASSDSGKFPVKKVIRKLQDNMKKYFYQLLKTRFGVTGKPYVEMLNEKNLWLYDRYSLQVLLKKGGFKNVNLVSYKFSGIRDWPKYDFDRSEIGDHPLEPSVYAEGVK